MTALSAAAIQLWAGIHFFRQAIEKANIGYQPFLSFLLLAGIRSRLVANFGWQLILAGNIFFFLAATFGWHIHLAVRYFRMKTILVLQPF